MKKSIDCSGCGVTFKTDLVKLTRKWKNGQRKFFCKPSCANKNNKPKFYCFGIRKI